MRTVHKPVFLTGLISGLLCLVHFFTAVYVPSHSEQRSLNIPTLSALPQGLPYQPQALLATIAQWRIPAQEAVVKTEPTNEALANFDKTVLGNTTVALLGIYSKQTPVAVLALQQAGKGVSYARLAAGESSQNIELSQINMRSITLSYQGKQVKLQLFTPASAVTEKK